MRIFIVFLAAAGVLALISSADTVGAGRKAPDFTAGGPWINTGGKILSMADLRGKVVAVEIWTAGCYNIRYSHIGEGNYDETENMIRQLLAETV